MKNVRNIVLLIIWGIIKVSNAQSPFFDDFEDGDFNDWTVVDGTWQIYSPGYESDYCLCSPSGVHPVIAAPCTSWYGIYEVDYKIPYSYQDFTIRIQKTPFTTAWEDTATYYEIGLHPVGGDSRDFIMKCVGGNQTILFEYSTSDSNLTETNTWTHTRIERLSNGEINVYVNGQLHMSVVDTSITSQGALFIHHHYNCYFDNISYVPSPTVAHWTFEESTIISDTLVLDISGNGHHGIIYGPTTENGVMIFDGVDDYVRVSHTHLIDFDTTESFTLEALFKTTSSIKQVILQKHPQGITSTTHFYSIHMNDESTPEGAIIFGIEDMYVGGVSVSDDNEGYGWNDGNWHHVAGVRDIDAGKLYIYIDGEVKDSTDDNPSVDPSSSGDLVIGRNAKLLGTPDLNPFEGSMDEIRISIAALGPDEFFPYDTSQGTINEDYKRYPDNFVLSQNYPNPFNPFTTLRYDLPERAYVTITIYDILGREVRTLVNRVEDPGYKSVIWDATDDRGRPVSTGIYLYQIKTSQPFGSVQGGDFVETRKMILLK